MDISLAVFIKIATFAHAALKTSSCKRVVISEMQSAHRIADKISCEKDRNGALQRILTHLESAYELESSNSFWSFHSSDIDLLNKLCFHIALCHKELGASNSLIAHWLIENTYYTGDLFWSGVDINTYKNLLSSYHFDLFNKKILKPHDDYIKSVNDDPGDPYSSHL